MPALESDSTARRTRIPEPRGIAYEPLLRIKRIAAAPRKVHRTHLAEPVEFRRDVAAKKHQSRHFVLPKHGSTAGHACPLRKAMQHHPACMTAAMHKFVEHRIDVSNIVSHSLLPVA